MVVLPAGPNWASQSSYGDVYVSYPSVQCKCASNLSWPRIMGHYKLLMRISTTRDTFWVIVVLSVGPHPHCTSQISCMVVFVCLLLQSLRVGAFSSCDGFNVTFRDTPGSLHEKEPGCGISSLNVSK